MKRRKVRINTDNAMPDDMQGMEFPTVGAVLVNSQLQAFRVVHMRKVGCNVISECNVVCKGPHFEVFTQPIDWIVA